MARYLYSELASKIQQLRNIQGSINRASCFHAERNNEGCETCNYWKDRTEENIEQLIKEFMPSGSGWDCGTKIDLDASHANKLVFYGSFHHMNECGYYDGWTDHTIVATPAFVGNLDLRISGRNRNDIKEYLHELFYTALRTELVYSRKLERYLPAEYATRIEQTTAPAIDPALNRMYRKMRKAGFQANCALSYAKTELAWNERECGEHDEPAKGNVRLQIEPDDFADFEDLCGDVYNPDVNTDIPASKLEREKKQFAEKVNTEGVWGIVGQYFNGSKWITADSCWGFVGDNWKDSGYDYDIKAETLRQAGEMPTDERQAQ